MKIKTLTVCAMLSAMCAVLGYLSIDLGNIKISFETLPVLLGALLLGPVPGALIGLVGTFLYQLLRYGISATTVLWILPYVLSGFLAGWASRKNGYELEGKKLLAVVVANELLIMVLNTFVIYVDSKIYGWYYPALIWGSLALRFVLAVGKAVVFTALLPLLMKPVKKILNE